MENGQIVFIRNSAGKLKIQLDYKMSRDDVMRGFGKDKLPPMEHPRWEFHFSQFSKPLATLTDEQEGLPRDIYLAFFDYDTVEVWKGHFDNSEDPETLYETLECE